MTTALPRLTPEMFHDRLIRMLDPKVLDEYTSAYNTYDGYEILMTPTKTVVDQRLLEFFDAMGLRLNVMFSASKSSRGMWHALSPHNLFVGAHLRNATYESLHEYGHFSSVLDINASDWANFTFGVQKGNVSLINALEECAVHIFATAVAEALGMPKSDAYTKWINQYLTSYCQHAFIAIGNQSKDKTYDNHLRSITANYADVIRNQSDRIMWDIARKVSCMAYLIYEEFRGTFEAFTRGIDISRTFDKSLVTKAIDNSVDYRMQRRFTPIDYAVSRMTFEAELAVNTIPLKDWNSGAKRELNAAQKFRLLVLG